MKYKRKKSWKKLKEEFDIIQKDFLYYLTLGITPLNLSFLSNSIHNNCRRERKITFAQIVSKLTILLNIFSFTLAGFSLTIPRI